MAIKINHLKSYLPNNIAKGTVEQRYQKARLLNLKFYDELQDAFRNKEVAPKTFSQILRKSSDKNLRVDIFPSEDGTTTALHHMINSKGLTEGYTLYLPVNYYSKKIQKNSAKLFLRETQNFFNEIFFPKIFKRNLALLNNLPKNKKLIDFYEKTISGKNKLSEAKLDNFLSDIEQKQTQIDILQFFRYKVLSEQNTEKASYQIDKHIEKHSGFKYIRPDDFYNLDQFGYSEKLELIEKKLLTLINEQRALNRNI